MDFAMRTLTLALIGLGLALLGGLSYRQAAQRALPALPTSPDAQRTTPESHVGLASVSLPAPQRYVFVDTLAVAGDQPIFVLRGTDPRAKGVGVVLHGWCGHGMGVLQAFAYAAADAGRFLALQGDHHCGNGPLRGWSNDTDALDRRIDAALKEYLGEERPSEIVLMGSSQGVDRAIALARRFPRKYRRLILLSGPRAEPAAGLSGVAGAFFLVGQRENQRPTREMAARWQASGIPVQLRIVAHAGHADFGADAEPLMREAFRFLGVK